MLSIVQAILGVVLVKSIDGIEKSFIIEKWNAKGKEKVIQTQGINFNECYKNYDIIDLNRIETNDINAMLKWYGVEAAWNAIVKEIRNVFSVYGITVDYRHLSLIADFMTFNGEYWPFNRIGMEESSSPFLKMSYETTAQYLTNACLF